MTKSSCQFRHGRELTAKSRSAFGQQHANIHSIGLHLAQASHTQPSLPRDLHHVCLYKDLNLRDLFCIQVTNYLSEKGCSL